LGSWKGNPAHNVESNMASFEFTSGTHTCDCCKRPSMGGFFWLDRDVPVIFDCAGCAERNIRTIDRVAAVEAHVALCFQRMEAT
jgi:hypothetical protein